MFWVSSDLNSGKKVSFSFSGGGRGGGVFWVSSDLNSGKKVRVFHFLGEGGGVFWVIPDLDSGNNFNFWGRGVFCPKFQNRGVLEKFGQNFLEA